VASQVSISNSATGAARDAFPALPAAAKPRSTLFTPGYGGSGVVRRENSSASIAGHAWGAGAGTASGAQTPPNTAEQEDGAGANGQKKKGNKTKKQTLFHFG
jgi:hypothetical protein